MKNPFKKNTPKEEKEEKQEKQKKQEKQEKQENTDKLELAFYGAYKEALEALKKKMEQNKTEMDLETAKKIFNDYQTAKSIVGNSEYLKLLEEITTKDEENKFNESFNKKMRTIRENMAKNPKHTETYLLEKIAKNYRYIELPKEAKITPAAKAESEQKVKVGGRKRGKKSKKNRKKSKKNRKKSKKNRKKSKKNRKKSKKNRKKSKRRR